MYRYRKKGLIFVIVLSLIVGGCFKRDNEEMLKIEKFIDDSIKWYESVNISAQLFMKDMVVYSKKLTVVREETNISYHLEVKELSEDLYFPSVYKITSNSGVLSEEEITMLFPLKDKFNKDNISNYKMENDKITFKIEKSNAMKLFEIDVLDVSQILDGIEGEMTFQSEKIQAYKYIGVLTDGVNLEIIGEITY